MNKSTSFLIVLLLLNLGFLRAQAPPGYNTPIPPEILTPDAVKTRYLGKFSFSDGRPSKRQRIGFTITWLISGQLRFS